VSSLKDNSAHQQAILKKLYLIRDVEEAIAERYSEQEMRCPTHLSIGQEGAPSALAPLLTFDDYAVSSHRAHAHYIAKGGDIKAMIAEIYGKATGCSGGRGGSMHLIDESVGFKGSTAIVGNTIPLGVGLALSQKMRKQQNLTVVYFGDGATEEGAFYEAVNFAVVQKLPVLFVCENNLYSVYSDLSQRQPEGREIHKMAAGLGIDSYYADGNDVVAAYDCYQAVVTNIKAGQGPAFIELPTYRWREHCGPNYDNHIGYRTEEEYQQWRKLEPISRFEDWLQENGLMTARDMRAIREEVKAEVQQAFEFAKASPFPDATTVANYIYCEDE